MRVLIIGCGYVGLPLGAALAKAGHAVHGLNRSAERETSLRAAGILPVQADIMRATDLAQVPGPYDWIVNTVSSSRGGLDVYRQVFLEGTRHLLDWMLPHPPARYVFTSSSSVYGQTDGSRVDETSPTTSASPTSQVLTQTEQLLLESFHQHAFPAVILRLSGIYGPGRGHLFLQYLRDEARLDGQGDRMLNMIHLDDVVGAIQAALQHGQAGELYNVTDDEPVTQRDFFAWLSAQLGKPMPPKATEVDGASRKRGRTHKRVSNRKLKVALHYTLRYPSYREGYATEIERIGRGAVD